MALSEYSNKNEKPEDSSEFVKRSESHRIAFAVAFARHKCLCWLLHCENTSRKCQTPLNYLDLKRTSLKIGLSNISTKIFFLVLTKYMCISSVKYTIQISDHPVKHTFYITKISMLSHYSCQMRVVDETRNPPVWLYLFCNSMTFQSDPLFAVGKITIDFDSHSMRKDLWCLPRKRKYRRKGDARFGTCFVQNNCVIA